MTRFVTFDTAKQTHTCPTNIQLSCLPMRDHQQFHCRVGNETGYRLQSIKLTTNYHLLTGGGLLLLCHLM